MDPVAATLWASFIGASITLAGVIVTLIIEGRREAHRSHADERRRRLDQGLAAARRILSETATAVDVYRPREGSDRGEVRERGEAIGRTIKRLAIDLPDEPTRSAVE